MILSPQRSSSTSFADLELSEKKKPQDLVYNRMLHPKPAHSLKDWVNLLTKNKQGFSALHFAAFRGDLNMVKYLLAHEADSHVLNP